VCLYSTIQHFISSEFITSQSLMAANSPPLGLGEVFPLPFFYTHRHRFACRKLKNNAAGVDLELVPIKANTLKQVIQILRALRKPMRVLRESYFQTKVKFPQSTRPCISATQAPSHISEIPHKTQNFCKLYPIQRSFYSKTPTIGKE